MSNGEYTPDILEQAIRLGYVEREAWDIEYDLLYEELGGESGD